VLHKKTPTLGLAFFFSQFDNPIQCGSWLACDAGTSVFLTDRSDAIAGKPAPTLVFSALKLAHG
jgi:hypothetical protein